jgi:hypothetical protein
MRREIFEKQKKRFNEVIMRRGYSVPFQVREILKLRTNWYEGLTIDQIIKKVKSEVYKQANDLRKPLKKKVRERKICKSTIYTSIRKINQFSIPPFYIMSGIGFRDDGVKEFRYFVPTNDDDINDELNKLHGRGQNVVLRQKAIQGHAETLEKEQELKEIQLQTN